jgi:beta-RFAP synthase
MLRVRTSSRLHFGLLSLAGGAPGPDRQGEPVLPSRRFGGVGLMVEHPGVQVSAAAAAAWSAEGPLGTRALAFAHRFAQGVGAEHAGRAGESPALRAPDGLPPGPAGRAGPPQRLVVEGCAPEHAGLGTGTQLGLAVARALAAAWGLPRDAPALARHVGRGLRSALGVHGFEQGGFLVEAGQRAPGELAPLVARAPFPDAWRVVLALPGEAPGLHGAQEREAFARLAGPPDGPAQTDALCRLVLLGLLPALAERDLEAFAAALFDFNARAGAAFAPVQGGTYAGPRVAELVAFIRGQGIRGAGQSSWGPAVFAVVGDEERAAHLAGRIRGRFGLGPAEAFVTRACNHGALEETCGLV